MPDSTPSTEELFLILFWDAHDLYPELAPDWVRFRRGTGQMGMTDPEVITLSIMQEGRSNAPESFRGSHRVVEKDYLHLFPGSISRSRHHRRRKDLMGIQRERLRSPINRVRLPAVWLSMDSAPTAESPRWKSAQMSIWAAKAGFSPSKRQFFLGFRLHLLVSSAGAICDFVLSGANVGERRVAEHLLAVEASLDCFRRYNETPERVLSIIGTKPPPCSRLVVQPFSVVQPFPASAPLL